MDEPKIIVIHCAATPRGRDISTDTLRKWHKAKGWRDIGYHVVIELDGSIVLGRDFNIKGAHVYGHNDGTLAVCYVGGMTSDNSDPMDTRTANQKAAMLYLLKGFKKKWPNVQIKGHRDFSKDLDGDGVIEEHEWMKACPSFDALTEYSNL